MASTTRWSVPRTSRPSSARRTTSASRSCPEPATSWPRSSRTPWPSGCSASWTAPSCMGAAPSPDVLVLGGGGILGEAWMNAVLAGLEEATGFDARYCDGYVGTSAGSIVAAALAAGATPRSRLGNLPEPPPVPSMEAAGGSSLLARLLELGAATVGVAAGPLAAIG